MNIAVSVSLLFMFSSLFPAADQMTLQRGVDVLCATPGRLRDHIRRKSLSLNQLEFLVLDEADEMLKVSTQHPIWL